MDQIEPVNSRAWLGGGLVISAATFNMVLCFLNCHGLAISASHVIAGEVLIVGLAASLSYQIVTLQISIFMAAVLAYFCMIWLITGEPNIKVVRDVFIPMMFILCGIATSNLCNADRLVYILISLVVVVGLFEWFWLDQFLKLFDIIGFYLAKGRIDDSQTWMDINVAMNGLRPEDEGRTLFPFLGTHRVSSIFLEPVSIGNFCSIAFAWLLVRFEIRPLKNLMFAVLVVAVIILADDRLAAVTCLAFLVARILPVPPRTIMWLLPFLTIGGLTICATISSSQGVDQSIYGRLVGSGRLISGFEAGDWFGIGQRSLQSMLDVDSGYAYAIYAVGLPGLVLLWTAFIFARDDTPYGAGYRMLLAIYISIGFAVSQAGFSIKTAALAWFLVGASQNGEAMMYASRFRLRPSGAGNLAGGFGLGSWHWRR
jgi:putative polymerase